MKVTKSLEAELFLHDGSDKLALAVECSFYARACHRSRRILMDKIEDINGRTRHYKSGLDRLLAVLKFLLNRADLRFYED